MISTTFRAQLAELLNELSSCYSLCDTIRINRRLGNTHTSLDRLQDGLRSSINSIQIQFNTLRKLVGSRLDTGDDTSREALIASTRDVQDYIKLRLNDIAYRYFQQQEFVPRGAEVPGFREILRQWHTIEEKVTATLDALSLRLDKPTPPQPKPIIKNTISPAPLPKPILKATPKPDDVVISIRELDKLLYHMKNCWEEIVVDGVTLYRNCFDERKQQWERPEGYVRELPKPPKKVRRKVSWERTSKPAWDGW